MKFKEANLEIKLEKSMEVNKEENIIGKKDLSDTKKVQEFLIKYSDKIIAATIIPDLIGSIDYMKQLSQKIEQNQFREPIVKFRTLEELKLDQESIVNEYVIEGASSLIEDRKREKEKNEINDAIVSKNYKNIKVTGQFDKKEESHSMRHKFEKTESDSIENKEQKTERQEGKEWSGEEKKASLKEKWQSLFKKREENENNKEKLENDKEITNPKDFRENIKDWKDKKDVGENPKNQILETKETRAEIREKKISDFNKKMDNMLASHGESLKSRKDLSPEEKAMEHVEMEEKVAKAKADYKKQIENDPRYRDIMKE